MAEPASPRLRPRPGGARAARGAAGAARCGVRLRVLRALLGGLALAAAAPEGLPETQEEDGVLVLTDKNFEATVKSNPFILVEFYAPWCGHCKQFAPEYAGAAKQLKQADPPIPLAKVDATVEFKIAEDYGVRGYPTIRLFIDGRDQEYTGGRTEQNIVTWVLKKVGPATVALADEPAVEAFERDNRFAVVGVFSAGTDDDPQRSAFETAAQQLEDVMFAYSTSPAVAAKLQLAKVPGLHMRFPHDNKTAEFWGDMKSAEDIEAFVKAYRHPMVTVFNGEIAPDLFGDGRAILFLFRNTDEKGSAAEQDVRKAAPGFGRRLLVSITGSSEPMDQRLMDYVSVEPEELPTVRIVANPMGSMAKYKLDGAISEAALASFVQQYEAGSLRPHMRSEPAPAAQTGPVYKLVGSTFEAVVKDPVKDVLVEFYAPWCGHCKKLDPVYQDVAKKLESVGSLVVAKLDATANDVSGVDVEGFPTIKLWRADNKAEPLDYDGDRDVDSFVAWLEEKASLPFGREEVRSEL